MSNVIVHVRDVCFMIIGCKTRARHTMHYVSLIVHVEQLCTFLVMEGLNLRIV
jgi:hypothetical protein